MNHPPIIIFDFDGVILNSKGALLAMEQSKKNLKFKFNEKQLNQTSALEIIRIFEKCSKSTDLKSLKALNQNFNKLLPSPIQRWKFIIKTGILARKNEWIYSHFFPNTIKTLKILKSNGIIIGIATNAKKERLIKWIKKEKIFNLVDIIISRDDKSKYGSKPSPKPLLGLLVRLKKKFNWNKIDKTICIFVGDNVSDILAAKRAKIQSVGVLSGHSYQKELEDNGADFILKDISEIPLFLPKFFPKLDFDLDYTINK